MGKPPSIRIVLGVFFLGCVLEVSSHDQEYTLGGLEFALEAIFGNGSSTDKTEAIVHGIAILMRIMFGGYGIVTAMRGFLLDQNRQSDAVMVDGSAAKGADKWES